MNIKPIQIIPPGYVDILHPETDSSVVLMEDGDTLEDFKQTTSNKLADITNNYPLDGIYRQAIINGNFDVWQRGVVHYNVGSNQYTADRWQYNMTGSVVTRIERGLFRLGSTETSPTVPKYYLHHEVTSASGSTSNPCLIQQIEDGTQIFSGQTVTLSFWARADAPRVLGLTLKQHFGTGTGGSPSVDYNNSVTLTREFARYTATFKLDSIYGKSLTSNNDSRLFVMFQFPINTVHGIDIAQVQLNIGSTALPFQPKTFAEELRACQRYFEKSYNYGTALNTPNTPSGSHYHSGISDSGAYMYTTGYFKVPKRVIPVMKGISTTDGANDTWYLVKNDWNGNAWVNLVPSENGFVASMATTQPNAQANIAGHWWADAEL